eukprot:scaffold134350_cov25-Cyclotella_meneghiniana.AAC.1
MDTMAQNIDEDQVNQDVSSCEVLIFVKLNDATGIERQTRSGPHDAHVLSCAFLLSVMAARLLLWSCGTAVHDACVRLG